MSNSYRIGWTEWTIDASGVSEINWSYPEASTRIGVSTSVYGYNNSNWVTYAQGLKGWTDESLSNLSTGGQALGDAPAKPVADSRIVQFNIEPVGLPSGEASYRVNQDDLISAYKETSVTKMVDSGECPYTGTYDPVADEFVYYANSIGDLLSGDKVAEYFSPVFANGIVNVRSIGYDSSPLDSGFFPCSLPSISTEWVQSWKHVVDTKVEVYHYVRESDRVEDVVECEAE